MIEVLTYNRKEIIMIPDFDLENEDKPALEPSKLFSWWVRGMFIVAFIGLLVAYKLLN
jgi:hypothetical protein